jgi:hypothetical protein
VQCYVVGLLSHVVEYRGQQQKRLCVSVMFVFFRCESPIRSSVCSAGANRRYEIRRESPVIKHIVLFVFYRRESPIRSCLCSAGADRRFVFCDRSAVARRTSATTVTCTKWMRRRRSVGSSSRHSSDRVLVEQAGLRQGGGRSNLHCSDLSWRKSTRELELWLPSWRYSQGDPSPPGFWETCRSLELISVNGFRRSPRRPRPCVRNKEPARDQQRRSLDTCAFKRTPPGTTPQRWRSIASPF